MTVQSLLEIFPDILVIDFLRYFIAASAAYLIFWVIFIKQWQHRIIQKKFPTFKKMSYEFRYSMSTVFIFSLNGLFIHSMITEGNTQVYFEMGEHSWMYLLFSFALMLLIHDAYFYWAHRLMHHPKLFKHVHLVHHRSTSPTPWAAYSFHPIEAQIEAGVYYLFVFIFPVHVGALLVFLIYMISRNVIGHLGIEILPNWFIKNKFINWHTTTVHHDMHHKLFDCNYGLYFTWWDNWFGTTHEKYEETFDEVTSREKFEELVLEPKESRN